MKDLTALENKFKDLQQAIADYCCDDKCEEAKPSYDYVDNRIRWIQDQIEGLYRSFYLHQEGHLPPIEGAERLSKALKVLGLDGDYKVEKKVIYANDGIPQGFDFKFRV